MIPCLAGLSHLIGRTYRYIPLQNVKAAEGLFKVSLTESNFRSYESNFRSYESTENKSVWFQSVSAQPLNCEYLLDRKLNILGFGANNFNVNLVFDEHFSLHSDILKIKL